MMRAADMGVAQAILAGLAKINTERAALARGPISAGVRCNSQSGEWVNASVEDHAAIVRIITARLALQEAAWRRRAAQIGLFLETPK